jgi:hypothetical protein|tara:strand:- start:295 stop:543 length:249 start_codon:yes stop_codon:yes gene_type:complete
MDITKKINEVEIPLSLCDKLNEIEELVRENTEIGIINKKFTCSCGAKISLGGLRKHITTDKHNIGLKARKYEELMSKNKIVI